jgi:hypothetical protein
VRYLELGLGAAAELGGDGEQGLVDARLCQLVAVTLPALLQPLEASLTHGQQGQRYGQVTPLALRPGGRDQRSGCSKRTVQNEVNTRWIYE